MYDFIIIGAGIIGASIARELTRYNVKVLLLDKESDVGNHATSANSAIIHSGHDPLENTLKAKLCVRGNALYHQLKEELNIPLLHTGALLTAFSEAEAETLTALHQRAVRNGVNVETLDKDKALALEPHLNTNLQKALLLKETYVTYPWEVAILLVENAIENGLVFKRHSQVISIKNHNDVFQVSTKTETFKSRYVINAAGVNAEKIASLIETKPPYTITPRRGEYFVFDSDLKGMFNHVIYPTPSDAGKGVLITPQVHGNILLGPNSVYQDALEDVSSTSEGLDYVKAQSLNLTTALPFNKVIRTFTGIRASTDYKDFYIKASLEIPNLIHVSGIDSPGLTAAPAIAEYVIDMIIRPKEPLTLNKNFNPYTKKKAMFHSLTASEKEEAFKTDHRYGQLICKCEKITEADIVNQVHRAVPADSIKAIKKRARAGSGICQGGYCEHLVLKIIARELNIPLNQVNYFNQGTQILTQETKVKSND